MRNLSKNLDLKLAIQQIKDSTDYDSLFTTVESLNDKGLYYRQMDSGRIVLCRIAEGRAHHETLHEDYIVIGHISESKSDVSRERKDVVCKFVKKHFSEEKIAQADPKYAGQNIRVYENSIVSEGLEKKLRRV
jgi:hypothetical protein